MEIGNEILLYHDEKEKGRYWFYMKGKVGLVLFVNWKEGV